MGVWEFINSTTETVKRNAPPDFKSAKDACRTSYGYGSAAFLKINDAVRVNGAQKLKDYMPNEQVRAQILLYASKFARNAVYYGSQEAYNFVPCGKTIHEIVSKTVSDVKSENRNNRDMEFIGATGKTSSGRRNVLDHLEMQSKDTKSGYEKGIFADSTANQTPEDVLRIFMMKEFIGTHFLDDLIISSKGHGKQSK